MVQKTRNKKDGIIMTSGGQKFTKIKGRDHYFYDSTTLIIYWIKKSMGEVEKVSSGVKYTGQGSILKASRIFPSKISELKDKKKKKTKFDSQKLLGEHFDDFLVRSEKDGNKVSTLETKRNSVKHLREFFGSYLPSEIIPTSEQENDPSFKSMWLQFVDHMQKKFPDYNMSNLTKHFRAVVRFLHNEGIIQKKPRIFNPLRQAENIRRKKKRYRIYAHEEISLMDAVCNEDQRMALWFGYDMAFRLSDCVRLTWDRVDLNKSNPVIIFHGDENKTGFAGRVPVSDTCAELLIERRKSKISKFVFHLKSDPEQQMLEQGLKFEDVVRRSGVNYGSHQMLRHSRLTEDFSNASLDNALVMKMRRVSLQVALEHYIHPTDADLERFRNTSKVKRGSK